MVEPLRLYKTWRPESRHSINADAFCYGSMGKDELSFRSHGDPLYIELIDGVKYNGIWATTSRPRMIYFSSGVSDGSPLILYEMSTTAPIFKYPAIASENDVSVKTIKFSSVRSAVVLASMKIDEIETVRITPNGDGIQVDFCFRSNEDAMEWMLRR